MPRVAKEIKCNENDILALEAIVRNPLSDPHLAMKARAILLCLDGRENKDVASELKVRNNTVGDWRKAYIEGGIEGLKGKKRPGRRGNNAPDKREMVREKLKEEPEGAGGKWTAQALAAAVGTSVDTVRRALREEGVCLERKTQWKVPVEGMPAPACIGIAGIYLSDAGKAVVLYSSGESRTDLSRGKIPTRNAASASGLEEMLSQDGYVPITDALEFLAQDAPAAGKRARKGVSLQEYLNGIGRAVEGREGAMLHAVVLPGKGEDFPALSCRSMSITLAPDFESWAALAGVWIDPLCGAGSTRLKAVLFRYTDDRMAGREPVIWNADAAEAASPAAEEDAKSLLPEDAFTDPAVGNILRVSASIIGRDGSEISRNVEIPNGVPGVGEISYESPLALAASVGKVERAVSTGMNSVAKGLCEEYLDSALKKTGAAELE
ncbi:MAG: helix-turn-helix domain containing protein [Clostridia bacterium]|nr:helix-turn-helix domain containing protein [Clostridia bacterium]